MTKFLSIVSFLGLYCFGFEANAYDFSVKVKNNTDQDIRNVRAEYASKTVLGMTERKECFGPVTIPAGGSYEDNCISASVEKWQRRIFVTVVCPRFSVAYGQSRGYPRKQKFYNRNHATNNGDRYTVKIKSTDCKDGVFW